MTEVQKGHTFLISQGLIWALFPIVTIIGLKGIPSIVGLFWATVFSLLSFLSIILLRKNWRDLKNLQAWKYCFGVAIFNGVLYYGLVFYGLSKTVSVNGAIVSMFEVVTSYIFFQMIHKENISRKEFLGVLIATVGALLIFIPRFGHFYQGDIFIILATFFAPFGNRYAQKARKIVSSETVMFLRNLLAVPFLFVLAWMIGSSPLVQPLGNSIWWLLLNGLIILGLSKIFWMEGIHRISVTKAIALNSLNPFFTIIFAWILLREVPTPVQLLSVPLLVIGVFLLTNFDFNKFSFKSRKTELS